MKTGQDVTIPFFKSWSQKMGLTHKEKYSYSPDILLCDAQVVRFLEQHNAANKRIKWLKTY